MSSVSKMKKVLALSEKNIEQLAHILSYLEHEQDDFIEQVEMLGIEYSSLLTEYEILDLTLVPKDLQSHIYFRSRVLWYELADALETTPIEYLK